jgi:hypothetical protein
VLFLAAAKKLPRFFYCVFALPLLRNAQKRKKKTSKEVAGGGATSHKPHFFFMDFFCFRVFELPLVLQKYAMKKNKAKVGSDFFLKQVTAFFFAANGKCPSLLSKKSRGAPCRLI